MSVNSYSQQHVMQLEMIHPTGVHEWFCPVCARRVIMDWLPAPNFIFLDEGDASVTHTGITGGVSLRPPHVRSVDDKDLPDDLRATLEDALKDVDFDW